MEQKLQILVEEKQYQNNAWKFHNMMKIIVDNMEAIQAPGHGQRHMDASLHSKPIGHFSHVIPELKNENYRSEIIKANKERVEKRR
jgi:hypothetical protein